MTKMEKLKFWFIERLIGLGFYTVPTVDDIETKLAKQKHKAVKKLGTVRDLHDREFAKQCAVVERARAAAEANIRKATEAQKAIGVLAFGAAFVASAAASASEAEVETVEVPALPQEHGETQTTEQGTATEPTPETQTPKD